MRLEGFLSLMGCVLLVVVLGVGLYALRQHMSAAAGAIEPPASAERPASP